MKRMAFVAPAAVQAPELGRVGQLGDDLDAGHSRLFLDLADEPFLERLAGIDASGGHLRDPGVLEASRWRPRVT